MMKVALISLVFLAACDATPRQQTLRGVWEYGFEHNRFREPGRSYRHDWGWCVSQASYEMLAPEPVPSWAQIGRIELVIEAEVSPRRHYWHMGLCERVISIRRIQERRHVGFECYYDAATCAALARGEPL